MLQSLRDLLPPLLKAIQKTASANDIHENERESIVNEVLGALYDLPEQPEQAFDRVLRELREYTISNGSNTLNDEHSSLLHLTSVQNYDKFQCQTGYLTETYMKEYTNLSDRMHDQG